MPALDLLKYTHIMGDQEELGSTISTGSFGHEVLPQLPGYRSNTHRIGSKKQTLKYIEGQRYLLDPADGYSETVKNLKSSDSCTTLSLGRSRPGEPAPTKPAFRFVLNSNQVLCFFGYFKEAVHESNLENHRIRKCEILFYLEDDSMQINERKQENSGVPQGNFMKRHRVPYEGEEEGTVGLDDLLVGGTIDLYGRTYHIVGCNGSTRDYYEKYKGVVLDDNFDYPPDKYEEDRREFMSRETGMDPSVSHNIKKNPMKVFAEASLGNTVDNSGRHGFLKYDRKVLRFSCVWDDRTSLYGDMQHFKLHYFLTDNTVEVLSVYGQNSGRDPFPLLVKRSKLPGAGADFGPGFLDWREIELGKVVDVYSRPLLLVDADDQTRKFYESEGMSLGPAMQVDEDIAPAAARVVPPYTGFGSEEDSLTSCVGSLVQTAPKKTPGQEIKIMFLGRFGESVPEDADRRFVITYFLVDQTIMIREPPKRNSGIVGGNFLARMKLKDESGTTIPPGHLFVGATIQLAGHLFYLEETDNATLKFMESNPEQFPYSSLDVVKQVFSKTLDGEVPATPDSIPLEFLKMICRSSGLPDQAAITISRCAGQEDGSVDREIFLSLIA